MPHRHSRGKTGVHPLRSALVSLGLLTACNHQDPFPSGDPTPNGPRTTTPPIQLTLNPAKDRSPSWKDDGTVFAYAFDREDGPPGDACLAAMPADGGTRTVTKCRFVADSDTVRTLGPVAAGPGNTAAWLDARGLKVKKVPDLESIRVGALNASDTGIAVRTFPYPAPSGNLHATAISLTWITPTLLGYIGSDRFLLGPCPMCNPDTLLVGREVVLLDLSTSPATLTILPNTSEASSVFGSEDGHSVYFTRAGDTKVYERNLASGAEAMVHDFGAIVRGVNVRGQVLTAIVGGRVNYLVDPLIGARQVDSGGALVRVDLTDDSESIIPVYNSLLAHPALSPDGRSVIVEAYDTLSLPWQSDLYLVRLP